MPATEKQARKHFTRPQFWLHCPARPYCQVTTISEALVPPPLHFQVTTISEALVQLHADRAFKAAQTTLLAAGAGGPSALSLSGSGAKALIPPVTTPVSKSLPAGGVMPSPPKASPAASVTAPLAGDSLRLVPKTKPQLNAPFGSDATNAVAITPTMVAPLAAVVSPTPSSALATAQQSSSSSPLPSAPPAFSEGLRSVGSKTRQLAVDVVEGLGEVVGGAVALLDKVCGAVYGMTE